MNEFLELINQFKLINRFTIVILALTVNVSLVSATFLSYTAIDKESCIESEIIRVGACPEH